MKALIFDGLGIIFYPLCYEIFILRWSPFFWRSTYLLLFFFSPVKGKACDIICGDPFSFFSLSWMRWGVRNLRGIQFAVSSFYIMYEPLPHVAYWMFSNLDGHTFYFLWYCKERADSCDAVFAEHVFYTSWPFFFFFFCLVCFRLEAFWERRFRLIILATLPWLQLLPCDKKCFWNKWNKNRFCFILSIQIYRFSVFDLRE